MNIEELKQQIKDTIKTNNNGDITGQVLQNQLLAMIDTLAQGDKEIFVCDFIDEKTSSITDEQYNILMSAINAGSIILIGSNTYNRIINAVELSGDVLSLNTEYTIDVTASLILTTMRYEISVASQNGEHDVNLHSASQSFVYNGDGTKFLNDRGEYSSISSDGKGVEIIKISAINPTWMYNYSIDVEENNKIINCIDNGIPFVFQVWIGTSSNPYSTIRSYIFPSRCDVSNNRHIVYYNNVGLYETGDQRKNAIQLELNFSFEAGKTERYEIGNSINDLISLRYGGEGTKFLADDGDYREVSALGMDYVTINRRFSDSEFRYYGQVSVADYDKLYDAIVNKKALAVVWTENNAIYAMTLLGQKSTYVENTSIHIECIAIQYTTGNTGGSNGYGFEPLYLTLTRSDIQPGGIIEHEMDSEGRFIFLNSGDGSKYLADNGQYKEISGGGGESSVQFVDVKAQYQSSRGVYEWLLDNITFEQVEAAINANKLIVVRYKGGETDPLGYRFISTKVTKLFGSNQGLKGYNLFTISQDKSNAVDNGGGVYTFENDGIPVYAKVVTILTTGYVWFDGVQYSDQTILPVDLTLKTKGDGTKFLADNGEYKAIAAENTSPVIMLGSINENNVRKITQSDRDNLVSYLGITTAMNIPYDRFFGLIFRMGTGIGLKYAKVSSITEDTRVEVAVYKLLVRDDVSKQINEVTVNINQTTNEVTVDENVNVTSLQS